MLSGSGDAISPSSFIDPTTTSESGGGVLLERVDRGSSDTVDMSDRFATCLNVIPWYVWVACTGCAVFECAGQYFEEPLDFSNLPDWLHPQPILTAGYPFVLAEKLVT